MHLADSVAVGVGLLQTVATTPRWDVAPHECARQGYGPSNQVAARFGNAAVTRGVLLGRDPGLEIPLLPD